MPTGVSGPSATAENYAKAIYVAQTESEGGRVSMSTVATALGVVPGTATSMVKSLSNQGLVDYEPRVGVRLTREGERLALGVLRRHRLVEVFLVETLGLDWSEIHVEAEELEHAISDRVLNAIDRFLGHPRHDPHGDPIPSAEGRLEDRQLDPLFSCNVDQEVSIAQITDQAPEFLQFIESNGLMPGSILRIKEKNALAEALTVECLETARATTIGFGAAAKVLVEQVQP